MHHVNGLKGLSFWTPGTVGITAVLALRVQPCLLSSLWLPEGFSLAYDARHSFVYSLDLVWW